MIKVRSSIILLIINFLQKLQFYLSPSLQYNTESHAKKLTQKQVDNKTM